MQLHPAGCSTGVVYVLWGGEGLHSLKESDVAVHSSGLGSINSDDSDYPTRLTNHATVLHAGEGTPCRHW